MTAPGVGIVVRSVGSSVLKYVQKSLARFGPVQYGGLGSYAPGVPTEERQLKAVVIKLVGQ